MRTVLCARRCCRRCSCEDVAVRDTVLRTLLCEDVVAARYGAADAAM